LRAELNELKVGSRLDTLEHSLQELADIQRPGTGYGLLSQDGAANGAAGDRGLGGVGTVSTASRAAASSEWVQFEFTAVKDRMSAMERKAEALWHIQETDEELRGMVERLKHDVDQLRSMLNDTQQAARAAQNAGDKLEASNRATADVIREMQDKLVILESNQVRGVEERKEAAVRFENNVNQIWDQIRHVENSLSQRLTLAETSQVSTLQEVDEMKEANNEVISRVEDVRRHIVALESKLESFNTQVAAAISPLHASLADVKMRLEDLSVKKQDVASAVTVEDVNVAVSRAIDHADRRADNIIKSIGAMEERVEVLNDLKANKSDVVMTTDLEALLTAHAAELDRHLLALKEDIMKAVATKADKEELAALDNKLGARLSSLENAILKGLKAISDKVSAALAEKLDLSRFNEFKVQVRAILADVEDRLRDWSPAARGMKAPLDADGSVGATSCICCDSRVRSVRDLQSMGFSSNDKVFSPERLPNTEGLLPSINRSPDVAAHVNAKYAHRKKDVAHLLTKSTPGLVEGLPAPSGGGIPPINSPTQASSNLDAGNLLQVGSKDPSKTATRVPSGSRVKVDVETISGTIAQGRIPVTNPNKAAKNKNPPRTAESVMSPWDAKSTSGASIPENGQDLHIDTSKPSTAQ